MSSTRAQIVDEECRALWERADLPRCQSPRPCFQPSSLQRFACSHYQAGGAICGHGEASGQSGRAPTRSGRFSQAAIVPDLDEATVMYQTGHTSTEMLRRYRVRDLFAVNSAAHFGL